MIQNPFTRPAIKCLFCFRSFSPQRIVFRCEQPGCSGKALDTVYAKIHGPFDANGVGIPSLRGHVIVPLPVPSGFFSMSMPRAARCDVCDGESRAPICPECHHAFPPGMGLNQRTIAIIGGRTTGKTNYIATLIKRMSDIGGQFQFIVNRADDETIARWDREFYAPLFLRNKVINLTPSAAFDTVVKAPLLFRFTFRNGKQALNIGFFDTAGEDMKSLNSMDIQARYICEADAIIFLLDPLQIDKVRNLLLQQDPHTFLPNVDVEASPANIVDRLLLLFKKVKEIPDTRGITVPVALTLSKIDALHPLIIQDPSSRLRFPSSHSQLGRVDKLEVQSVSTEIASRLKDWIGPGFCRTIETRFPHHEYFGVSSLGSQPDPLTGDLMGPVAPFRVEDPFLWVLYKLKLIEGW